jgi:hypothetical protein
VRRRELGIVPHRDEYRIDQCWLIVEHGFLFEVSTVELSHIGFWVILQFCFRSVLIYDNFYVIYSISESYAFVRKSISHIILFETVFIVQFL